MTAFHRVALRTGIELNVATAGPDDAPPVILLHGFPESHRTWRELVPRLEHRFRLIMPDLRGFGASDKPTEVKAYRSALLIQDLLALASALHVQRFSVVGHDLGGVLGWNAAQRHPERIERLAIVNAPHPTVFQRSLFTSPEQRRASQYINMLKVPGADRLIARDLDGFFHTAIGSNVERVRILEAEKQAYLAEWSQPGALAAMLKWYRASPVIVPPPFAGVPVPKALLRLSPRIQVPVKVIWGMRDHALMPVQLEDLDQVADDLTIVRLPDVGHWAPWEAPDVVAQALEPFLAAGGGARAQAR